MPTRVTNRSATTIPATPAPLEERPARRTRSAAAERAYAKRAQRMGEAPAVKAKAETRRAGSKVPFVVLIMGLLAVGVVSTLWLSTQAVADSYRLDQAKTAATNLAERAERLRREVAQLDSAQALSERAKAQGMIPANDPARMVVRPDGSISVVGDAKPVRPAPPPPPPAPPAPPEQQTPPAQTQQQAPPAQQTQQQAQRQTQRQTQQPTQTQQPPRQGAR
ncbi:septum formation initiator [Herbihabitans rhizosphaerae]|uniref:septum formation initiator n=1 Tax=Herbihabitans rhizosphaerae TaxID=1872711 RepID=UPI00102CD9E9|nr:septum formation initiator [Herbihabitans rhizosphaerae]